MTTATLTATEVTAAPPNKQPRNYPLIGLWIALGLSCLIWLAPFVFMIFTSLQTPPEISNTALWAPPKSFQWHNYIDAAERGNFTTVFRNSLFIAVIKVPLGLFISAACAFAIARIRFRRYRVVLLIITLGAMVPVQVALAPM